MTSQKGTMKNGVEILIVEDSPTQAAKLEFFLEQHGYQVSVANNGKEAIASMSKRKPTIAISDIIMPEMDGYELCRQIKADENLKDIPVILLTSLSNPEDIVRSLECGADNFITKPYDEKYLLSRIQYILISDELRKSIKAEIGIEIFFAGRKHFLTSERMQIIDLLLSSFKTAVNKNLELEQKNIELRKALETIKTLEANYRALLENNGDAMIVVGRDGMIMHYVNPAAEALFNRTAEKLLGNLLELSGEVGNTKEIEIIRSGGEKAVVEIRMVEIEWENEVACLVTLHDITDRRRALAELEQTRQQQMQIKDQFLSNVSHEFRSPLTAIYQFITILLDGLAGELNPEQHEYLGIVLKNVDQLRTMIDELMEINRAQIGKLSVEPQPISLAKLIDETLSSLRASTAAKGITLSAEVPRDLPPAYADPQRVRQVLINLIENGVKFTPENGMITVRAQVSNEDSNFLCVAVADTGCGISPDESEKIFERLYQAKNTVQASRKGLGLGLYICKELVSHQGGRIWVKSQLGYGSTFFFTLPIFSLTVLLAPILTAENLLKGSAGFIVIEIFPVEKRPLTRTDETALKEIRYVVERCVLPFRDLLLHGAAFPEERETFFVVACADQSGVEIIVQRIQEQLARCKDLRNAGLDSAVSFTMVGIPSGINNKPLEQVVRDIANSIEDLMKVAILPKGGIKCLREKFS